MNQRSKSKGEESKWKRTINIFRQLHIIFLSISRGNKIFLLKHYPVGQFVKQYNKAISICSA